MVDHNVNFSSPKSSSPLVTQNKLLIWIQAIRAPFFTASVIPLLLGMALAYYETRIFDPILGILLLIAGIAVHGGTNLLNDYFDQETDRLNEFYSAFNGGSRMIQNEIIPPRQILIVSICCYILAFLAVSVIILLTQGILLLILLGIAIMLGAFYTAIPIRLSYRGLGEFAVFVGFGPLGVVSAYYIQTNLLNLSTTILISLPIAFMIAMVLFINEFQDFDADSLAGKNTMVVLIGKKKASFIYITGMLLSYFCMFFIVFIQVFPLQLLIMVLTFPLTYKSIQIVKTNYNAVDDLLPANKLTIMIHLLSGLLLTFGLVFLI